MQFENYPIKTVGKEAFYSYFILYHYFKISKNRQKFKNSLIVKKSTSQVNDIILGACMQFENYPIKTVGGEAFYSYYILYHYFKISKIRQKFKNTPIIKKSTSHIKVKFIASGILENQITLILRMQCKLFWLLQRLL